MLITSLWDSHRMSLQAGPRPRRRACPGHVAEALEQRLCLSTSNDPIAITVGFADTSNNPVTQLAPGSIFRINVFAQDCRTTGADVGVLSAFVDVVYDTDLINVTNITHAFNDFVTGTVQDGAGLVDEVGGLESTRPANRDP